MNIPLSFLNKVVETELPAPGSINFTNCQDLVEIPVFKTVGIIATAEEGDPVGIGGGSEWVKELAGTLVFKKGAGEWELVMYCREEVEQAIRITKDRIEKQYKPKEARSGQGPGEKMQQPKKSQGRAGKTFVTCSECGRVFRARVPKGGDGSMWVPAWHKNGDETCPGSHQEGQ